MFKTLPTVSALNGRTSYSELQRIGQAMTNRKQNANCPYTIRDMENREDHDRTCNYQLGHGLFLDLYDQLSAGDFQRAFRYLWASTEDQWEGVYHVRAAFYPGSQWVQALIDDWYGYREKPEAHWGDGAFLAYYTWKKDGDWWTQTRGDRPCADRVKIQESGTRYSASNVSLWKRCEYVGDWDNGDLLVGIRGVTYRAVRVVLSKEPW